MPLFILKLLKLKVLQGTVSSRLGLSVCLASFALPPTIHSREMFQIHAIPGCQRSLSFLVCFIDDRILLKPPR